MALSLATDLGLGQPMEHGLRTCLLALAASEELGLDANTNSSVYYVALLRFTGCTSDAAETAALSGGDDIGFNRMMAPMFNARAGEMTRYFIRHLAEDQPLHRRAARVFRAMSDPGGAERSLSGHCEVAARLATRLGMDDRVVHALAHAYERWDGEGYPSRLGGDDVPVEVRVVTVARDVELMAQESDWSAVVDVLSGRRGQAYDPSVVDAFIDHGRAWLDGLGDDPCAAVLDAEPHPALTIGDDKLDDALGAIADFADVKSPFFRGHSSGVARLAAEAARAVGMSESEAATVGRAALVHDVGRVGVANDVWDARGPLNAHQWERVRLHPYLSERVLRRCSVLAPLADVAACHHERVDGSGYYRAARGDQLSLSARILAVADAFHAMTEERPHRPPLEVSAAAALLQRDRDAGRFSRAEVDAVLEAAGEIPRPAQVARPAGLTEREVDVLRLIARGHSNKQAAAALGISAKTVGSHVEHIYAKAGVTTRAGATLFAMEHQLLAPST